MKKSVLKWIGISLLILLLIILVGPFLVPVRPAAGTVPPQQLADPDSRFVEINSLNVHYKINGQGNPVFILLHGFGASLFSWHAVMQPLGEIGTVIAYDRPAFGLTERPLMWSGTNPYSPEGNQDLLLSLVNHFGIKKAILVGNSAGGTLAMQFALAYPDRVQALVLVDPAVYEGGGGPAWVRLLGKLPQVQHLGPLLVRSIQDSGRDLVRLAWHNPALITQETWDGYTKPLQADNWDQALWDLTMASHDSGLTSRLQEFHVPILVITGDDDRIVPTADSLRLADELPGAQLSVIEDAGHVPQEEQPDAFLDALYKFVLQLP